MTIRETKSNIDAELAVCDHLRNVWGVRITKSPPLCPVDAAVYIDGLAAGFIEVKCRANKYHTLMIDVGKICRLRRVARDYCVPGLLVVKWGEAPPQYIDVCTDLQWGEDEELGPIPVDVTIERGGREDRGDPEDIDLCAYIPVSRFRPSMINPFKNKQAPAARTGA